MLRGRRCAGCSRPPLFRCRPDHAGEACTRSGGLHPVRGLPGPSSGNACTGRGAGPLVRQCLHPGSGVAGPLVRQCLHPEWGLPGPSSGNACTRSGGLHPVRGLPGPSSGNACTRFGGLHPVRGLRGLESGHPATVAGADPRTGCTLWPRARPPATVAGANPRSGCRPPNRVQTSARSRAAQPRTGCKPPNRVQTSARCRGCRLRPDAGGRDRSARCPGHAFGPMPGPPSPPIPGGNPRSGCNVALSRLDRLPARTRQPRQHHGRPTRSQFLTTRVPGAVQRRRAAANQEARWIRARPPEPHVRPSTSATPRQA